MSDRVTMVRESLEIVRASSAPVNQVLAQMLKPDEKAAIRYVSPRFQLLASLL